MLGASCLSLPSRVASRRQLRRSSPLDPRDGDTPGVPFEIGTMTTVPGIRRDTTNTEVGARELEMDSPFCSNPSVAHWVAHRGQYLLFALGAFT